MLVITLMYADGEWTVEVIDIKTAFLEADLKEELWIEIPDGYEFAFGEIDRARYVMLLLKAMYGLVLARFTKLSARYLPLLISACYKARLTRACFTSRMGAEG